MRTVGCSSALIDEGLHDADKDAVLDALQARQLRPAAQARVGLEPVVLGRAVGPAMRALERGPVLPLRRDRGVGVGDAEADAGEHRLPVLLARGVPGARRLLAGELLHLAVR